MGAGYYVSDEEYNFLRNGLLEDEKNIVKMSLQSLISLRRSHAMDKNMPFIIGKIFNNPKYADDTQVE